MADLQDMLLFVNYHGKMFERNGRVVLPRNNPFDDYDDKKFLCYPYYIKEKAYQTTSQCQMCIVSGYCSEIKLVCDTSPVCFCYR